MANGNENQVETNIEETPNTAEVKNQELENQKNKTEENKTEEVETPPVSKDESIEDFFDKEDGFSGSELDLTIDSKTITESQIEEAEYHGVPENVFLEVETDTDKAIGEYQSWMNQFGRAVAGGVYKGTMTFIENVGYVADVPGWFGFGNDFEEGYTNFLSEWASEEKARFDEANPIYGDSAFAQTMRGLQGLVDSTVGFAGIGAGAGSLVKGGVGLLNQLVKAGKIYENVITKLGTAAITNYAESTMMGAEMHKEIMDKALANDMSRTEANRIADEEVKDFLWTNKVNIFTDAIALKGLVKGDDIIRGGMKQGFKQGVINQSKQAVGESWEEMSAGFFQQENTRDAELRLNLEQEDKSSYLGRMGNYFTSEEGLTEGLMGAIGGPFQHLTTKAFSSGVRKAREKLGLIDPVVDPGEFTQERPRKEKIVKNVQDPMGPAPVDPATKYMKANPGVSREDAEAAISEEEREQYKKEQAEYKATAVSEEEYKASHEEYKKQVEAWKKAKAEHDLKKQAYVNYMENRKLGTRLKAKEDLDAFFKEEGELIMAYREAVIKEDGRAMADIENQRFEGLFARYANRGMIEGLENHLKEIEAGAEGYTAKDQAKATELLSKMEGYTSDYMKLYNKHGRSKAADLFKLKARIGSIKETMEGIDQDLDLSRNKIIKEIKTATGRDVNPLQLELMATKAEMAALNTMKMKLRGNPDLKIGLKEKIEAKEKEIESRIGKLDEEIKTAKGEGLESFGKLIGDYEIESLQSYKEFVETAANKMNAWVGYQGLSKVFEFESSSKSKKELRKKYYDYLTDQIENKTFNERDVYENLGMIAKVNLSDKQKEELIDKLNIANEQIAEEAENTKEQVLKAEKRINAIRKLKGEISQRSTRNLKKWKENNEYDFKIEKQRLREAETEFENAKSETDAFMQNRKRGIYKFDEKEDRTGWTREQRQAANKKRGGKYSPYSFDKDYQKLKEAEAIAYEKVKQQRELLTNAISKRSVLKTLYRQKIEQNKVESDNADAVLTKAIEDFKAIDIQESADGFKYRADRFLDQLLSGELDTETTERKEEEEVKIEEDDPEKKKLTIRETYDAINDDDIPGLDIDPNDPVLNEIDRLAAISGTELEPERKEEGLKSVPGEDDASVVDLSGVSDNSTSDVPNPQGTTAIPSDVLNSVTGVITENFDESGKTASEMSTLATEKAMNAGGKNTDIAVTDVTNPDTIPPISDEHNDNQEHAHDEYPWTLSYLSHSDGWGKTNSNNGLVDWLESFFTDKVNTKFRFEVVSADGNISKTDKKTGKKIYPYRKIMDKYLKDPSSLTEEEMNELPIRMYAYDNNGKKLRHAGNLVYAHFKSGNYPFNTKEQTDSVRAARKAILKGLQKGEQYETEIEKVSTGKLKSDTEGGTRNDPRDYLGKPKSNGEGKLFVANGIELVSNTTDNIADEEMQDENRDSVGGGIAGFIFMKTRSLDNKPFPLKLNSRKLNPEEVQAIMEVVIGYVNGSTPNQPFKGNSDISGIPNKAVLDLLVYSGKQSLDKEYPFYINLSKKNSSITFGKDQKTIPLKEFSNKSPNGEANQKELAEFLSTMWRGTNAKHLNKKLKEFEGIDGKFTWLGVNIDAGKMEYNDFQFAQKALSTNATFPNNRLFIQPTVTFKDPKRWRKIDSNKKKDSKATELSNTMDKVKTLQETSKKSKLDTVPSKKKGKKDESVYKLEDKTLERQSNYVERKLEEELPFEVKKQPDEVGEKRMKAGASVGNFVDNIGRDIFDGAKIKSLAEYVKEANEQNKENGFTLSNISQEEFDFLVDYLKGIKKSLPKMKFISKDLFLHSNFTQEQVAALGKDGVGGTLDLIGVDEEGKIHIIDFKNKKFNKDREKYWDGNLYDDSNDYDAAITKWGRQLSIYKEMLEQQGFEVASLNILLVPTEYSHKDGNVTFEKFYSPDSLGKPIREENQSGLSPKLIKISEDTEMIEEFRKDTISENSKTASKSSTRTKTDAEIKLEEQEAKARENNDSVKPAYVKTTSTNELTAEFNLENLNELISDRLKGYPGKRITVRINKKSNTITVSRPGTSRSFDNTQEALNYTRKLYKEVLFEIQEESKKGTETKTTPTTTKENETYLFSTLGRKLKKYKVSVYKTKGGQYQIKDGKKTITNKDINSAIKTAEKILFEKSGVAVPKRKSTTKTVKPKSEIFENIENKVKYTFKGSRKEYAIKETDSGIVIINWQGKEVFSEKTPSMKTHRNKIIANYEISIGRAVIVEHSYEKKNGETATSRYVVNKDGVIMTLAKTRAGNIMNWGDTHPMRNLIYDLANEAFDNIAEGTKEKKPVKKDDVSKPEVNEFVEKEPANSGGGTWSNEPTPAGPTDAEMQEADKKFDDNVVDKMTPVTFGKKVKTEPTTDTTTNLGEGVARAEDGSEIITKVGDTTIGNFSKSDGGEDAIAINEKEGVYAISDGMGGETMSIFGSHIISPLIVDRLSKGESLDNITFKDLIPYAKTENEIISLEILTEVQEGLKNKSLGYNDAKKLLERFVTKDGKKTRMSSMLLSVINSMYFPGSEFPGGKGRIAGTDIVAKKTGENKYSISKRGDTVFAVVNEDGTIEQSNGMSDDTTTSGTMFYFNSKTREFETRVDKADNFEIELKPGQRLLLSSDFIETQEQLDDFIKQLDEGSLSLKEFINKHKYDDATFAMIEHSETKKPKADTTDTTKIIPQENKTDDEISSMTPVSFLGKKVKVENSDKVQEIENDLKGPTGKDKAITPKKKSESGKTTKNRRVQKPVELSKKDKKTIKDINAKAAKSQNDLKNKGIEGEDEKKYSIITKRKTKADIAKEIENIQKILPNVPVEVAKTLIEGANGGLAEGQFYKGVVTIANGANEGIAYHEGFHAVMDGYLTKRERDNIIKEVQKKYGSRINAAQAEEILAEEFREYMLSKGTLKVPGAFKWLYDLFLDLVNVFRSNKGKIFSKIRSSRFDYVPPFAHSKRIMNKRLKGNPKTELVHEAVDHISHRVIMLSGIKSIDQSVAEGFNDLDVIFKMIKNEIIEQQQIALDKGDITDDYTEFDDLEFVTSADEDLDNWDDIVQLVKDELTKFSLLETGAVTDETPMGEINEEDASGGLNIKPALTYSGRDNATHNTRFMVKMLTDKKSKSKYFGGSFNKLANFHTSWRILEDSLANIVETKDHHQVDLMLNKIKELSQTHPEFIELLEQLEAPESVVPLYKKIQFYRAFSKQKVIYNHSQYKIEGDEYNVKIGNADQQSHSKLLRNQFIENFTEKFLDNGEFKPATATEASAREQLLGVVNTIESIAKEVTNNKEWNKVVKSESFDLSYYDKISDAFKKIGIEVEPATIRAYVMGSQVTRMVVPGVYEKVSNAKEAIKFKKAFLKGIVYPFLKGGKGIPYAKNNASISLEHMLSKDYDYEEQEGKTFIEDNSIFQTFAAIEGYNKKETLENMVLGPENNLYWTKSLNNFISKNVNQWKSDSKSLSTLLFSSKYHQKSKWIKYLLGDEYDYNSPEPTDITKEAKQRLENFGVQVYLSNRVENNSNDKGTAFKDTTSVDMQVDSMNKVLNGVRNKNGSVFSPLTLADKSSHFMFTGLPMEQYEPNAEGNTIIRDIDSQSVLDMFEYFLAEIDRYSNAQENKSGNAYFDDKGSKKLFWFPELSFGTPLANEIGLYDSKGNADISSERVKDAIKEHIKETLEKQHEQAIKKLKENNIIRESKNENTKGELIITGIDSTILSHYRSKSIDTSSDTAAINNLVFDYMMNSMIANIEFTMLFTGDPAFYNDISKRTPATSGQGTDLIHWSGETPKHFNLVTIKDATSKRSDLYENYEKHLKQHKVHGKRRYSDEEIKQILKPYSEGELNKADGQAYITPERYRALMIGLGKWETSHEDAYKKLMKPGAIVNPRDLAVMQPLKGMHFELRNENGFSIPTYLKYSQAPLWPALVKGTEHQALLKKMRSEKIDELVYESGIKSGSGEVYSKEDIISGKVKPKLTKLSNYYWKLQQDLPTKYENKGESLVGSQPRKNIFQNMFEKIEKDGTVNKRKYKYKGKVIEALEMANKINAIESKLSDIGRQKFDNKYGVKDGRITNQEPIYEHLIEKFTRDGVDMNVIEQLENRVPLSLIFQHSDKIEQEIFAELKKATVKLTSTGGSFIQIAGEGFAQVSSYRDATFNKNGIRHLVKKENGALKGPRVTEDGSLSAQVYLPFKDVENIPNWETMTDEELKDALGDTVKNIVGYRIPNQKISGMDSLEIVGILPPSAGDSIVVYDEITGKTGSDFDIDKMYVMMYNTVYNPKTKKLERINETNSKLAINPKTKKPYGKLDRERMNLENERLEMWASVLESKDTFTDAILPVDTAWLKNEAYYLHLLNYIAEGKSEDGNPNIEEFLNWYNKDLDKNNYLNFREFMRLPKEQRDQKATDFFKQRQGSSLEFANPFTQMEIRERNLGGKAGVGITANHLTHHNLLQIVELAQVYNNDNDSISEIISAYMNAYVDNAKDPFISLINNNITTANTVFYMLRQGLSPSSVNRLLSLPEIRDYVKNTESQNSKLISKETKTHTKILGLKEGGTLNTVNAKESAINPWSKTFENFPHLNLNKEALEKLSITDLNLYTNEQLEDMIARKQSDPGLILFFMKMESDGREFQKMVTASKYDTDGPGSSMAEWIAKRNLESQVKEGLFHEEYNKVMEDTFIGAMKKNAFDDVQTLMSNLFMTSKKSMITLVNGVNSSIGMDSNYKPLDGTDVEFNKKVIKAYQSYVFSNGFEIGPEKIKSLFYGKRNMARRLIRLRNEPGYDSNPFLLALGTELNNFVTFPSSKKKDGREKDKLWTEWEELYENEETKEFAKDLIIYAYVSSGFQKNINSFFDLIPNTILQKSMEEGILPFNEIMQNTIAEGINFDLFFDQFIANNVDILPTTKYGYKKLVPISNKITKATGGFKVKTEDIPFPFWINKKAGILRKFVAIETKPNWKDPVTGKKVPKLLYQLIGTKGGHQYYKRVPVLGMSEKGNHITEYDYDNPITQSAVNPFESSMPEGWDIENIDDRMGQVGHIRNEDAPIFIDGDPIQIEDIEEVEEVTEEVEEVEENVEQYYEGNITPEPNTIFVFGSNPEGRHGKGAAKIAKDQFGAIYGQGEGLQGNAYALPTKDLRVKENRGFKSISKGAITTSIIKLYEVAKQNPDKQFKVAYRNTTEMSLNGYTGLEMIEMFNNAEALIDRPSNIVFSKEWFDTGMIQNTQATTDTATQSTVSSPADAIITMDAMPESWINPTDKLDKLFVKYGLTDIAERKSGILNDYKGTATPENNKALDEWFANTGRKKTHTVSNAIMSKINSLISKEVARGKLFGDSIKEYFEKQENIDKLAALTEDALKFSKLNIEVINADENVVKEYVAIKQKLEKAIVEVIKDEFGIQLNIVRGLLFAGDKYLDAGTTTDIATKAPVETTKPVAENLPKPPSIKEIKKEDKSVVQVFRVKQVQGFRVEIREENVDGETVYQAYAVEDKIYGEETEETPISEMKTSKGILAKPALTQEEAVASAKSKLSRFDVQGLLVSLNNACK